VPEGEALFFPVINSVNIDTPNVCGQGPEKIPVEDLRAVSAAFIDGASNLLAEVDGEAIDDLRRIVESGGGAGPIVGPLHSGSDGHNRQLIGLFGSSIFSSLELLLVQ
jgi:hypothetical protein